MSAREPRKPGLSPSPLVLVVALVIVMLIGIGAVSLLQTALTAPAPAQMGAQQSALAQVTATVPTDEDEEPNYDLTPTQVLPLPSDVPLPPGFKTVAPPPEPTALTYTPGPTASLEEVAPIEEWQEYVNEKQGFTIKYPPNWYLNAGPTGQTTQIFSYDFNDPSLADYKGPPLNLTKIEIGISSSKNWPPAHQLREGETLREWVAKTGRVSEDDKLIEEEDLTVDGLPALRQLVDFEYGGLIQVVYVKRTDDVIIIGQPYREQWAVPNQIFEVLIASFRVQR